MSLSFRSNGRWGSGDRVSPIQLQDHGNSTATDSPIDLPESDEDLGISLGTKFPTQLIGIGTASSELVHRTARFVTRENGGVPPPNFDYLLIDAESKQPLWDNRHAPDLGARSAAGSGTNPNEARPILNHAWPELRQVVAACMDGICSVNNAGQRSAARQNAVDSWLVAGAGGTGGGMLDPFITLLHQVARACAVALRVHLVMIGHQIALLDRTRQPIREQFEVVSATFGSNVVKQVSDIQDATLVRFRPPDGPEFDMRLCDRVHSLFLVDRSNGRSSYQTVDSFQDMLAQALALRAFTQTAPFWDARHEDARKLGLPKSPLLNGESP